MAKLLRHDIGAMRATVNQDEPRTSLDQRSNVTAHGRKVDALTPANFDDNHQTLSAT